MHWANIFIPFLVAGLIALYFLPYKKLKGKIFKKLIYDTSKIRAAEYKSRSFSVRVERDGKDWKMAAPEDWQADGGKVRRLMLKLSELDVDSRINGADPEDAEYGIGKNGDLILDFKGKDMVLSLGLPSKKDGELMYLTKTGDKDVLLVSSSFLHALPKTVDSFKNMKLFEAYYPQVKSVEAGRGEEVFLIIRIENGWILRGREVFEEKVQPFVESILEWKAVGFASLDLKLPAKPDVFVTLKIGNKGATRYFFSLESEPENYLTSHNGRILKISKETVNKIFYF